MVFGQLVTATYNMKEFNLNKDLIEEVINSFSKQHCLNNELHDTLINTIYDRN